jgi:hypothetical protein
VIFAVFCFNDFDQFRSFRNGENGVLFFCRMVHSASVYWKEKTIPQHATAFESFRCLSRGASGFRVGVGAEDGDGEEKFATLFDGPRVVPYEGLCLLAGFVSGSSTRGEQVFFSILVLLCAMNKDIPA